MIDLGPDSSREFRENPFAQRYRIAVFFTLFALCCFTRLWDLGSKSMMHDELLFANYTYYDIFERMQYYYQPILHGPAMLHLQSIVMHLFGDTDYTIRLGCALLGVFGFFWIWKLRYWLGEMGTWFALLFYTLSPGITFYQRFFRNDALFLFTSLWIVASFANWWRTKDARWGASALVGCTVLFTNKESSLFIYFSVFTFFLLLAIHDVVKWILEGKSESLSDHLRPMVRFPNPVWPTLAVAGMVILCLTQIFEGITYDLDVQRAIGHDWVLKDIRSIPIALGWQDLGPNDAPDAGPLISSAGYWRMFYGVLFFGLLAAFCVVKVAVDRRLGSVEFLPKLWDLIVASRFHLLAALGLSVFIYLAMFTTFFKHEIGFFEIYAKTWSYWGGQHEWGRIGGPFHQHMLNTVIYEFPALIIVVVAWFFLLFRVRPARIYGLAFFLMIIAVGAFHKLMFSGVEVIPAGAPIPVPARIDWLKNIFLAGALLGATVLIFPRAARAMIPAACFGLIAYCWYYINTDFWRNMLAQRVYKESAPVELAGRHVTLNEYIEIQFNFDAGWNVAIVLLLIFFATLYTWRAIDRHDRFHGFLIWWTVTSIGAASYAREAVPQIGIHAQMPLILLAGSYAQKFFLAWPRWRMSPFPYIVLGVLALWNVKNTFVLNFHLHDDPVERMVYGPNHPDIQAHMNFIRDYWDIAPLRMEGSTPYFLNNYNEREKHKDVRIYMRPIDPVSWSAKWYLRDIDYTQGSNPAKAIEEGWEFLFLLPEDVDKFPALKEKYNLHRGRGTMFWMPSPIAQESLTGVWKAMIPGHRVAGTPEEAQARTSLEDWRTIRRYLLMREAFNGTNRPFPSISSLGEYVFAFRKDLY